MSVHLGTVPASSTLYVPFATYGKTNGESITLTGLAVTDIEIYKNGSVTQRASDAGYALLDTDGVDFDGVTGIHGFSIDLSDNTDAGFYAVGSFYWVVVSAVTVDSQTVNFIAATFRIGVAENTAGTPVVDVGRISNDATAADNAEAFFDGTGYAGTGNVIPTVTNVTTVNGLAAGVITAASIAADAITDAKVASDVTIASVTGSVGSVTAGVGISSGGITSASFAAGAINAAAIASGAIDRDAFAADTGLQSIRSNTAQAGAASTITLDASASAVDDYYNGTSILLTGGTGSGQFRIITDYVGSSKVATVDAAWATNPDATTTFAIFPSADTAADIADAVWDEDATAHQTQGSFGQAIGDPVSDAGTIFKATVTDATGVTVGADTASLLTQVGTAGAGLTALPWNAAWDAEVQSEVDDAINTAIAELGVGAPTATPTLRTGMMLMYMALRNKLVVQTSGTDAIEVYNDAGTKIASKLITDDGSDYTEAEMS